MVKRWAIPIVVTLIGAAMGGPIVGVLAGILAALVWPLLTAFWQFQRYLQLIERQEKFLEEYDVYAVSPAEHQGFFLATLGETDPGKAFLMDRKAIRMAKLAYPTKAKTAADRKALWDKEEERRLTLGFPSQNTRRDYQAEWPYHKPHYRHLKAGIKVATCWLCDQDTADQDQTHLEIWSRFEREEAEEKAKDDSAKALFNIGEIPPANTLRCEEAEQLYAKLKLKYAELHGVAAEADLNERGRIYDAYFLIQGRINAARACGKYGPCTIHVFKT